MSIRIRRSRFSCAMIHWTSELRGEFREIVRPVASPSTARIPATSSTARRFCSRKIKTIASGRFDDAGQFFRSHSGRCRIEAPWRSATSVSRLLPMSNRDRERPRPRQATCRSALADQRVSSRIAPPPTPGSSTTTLRESWLAAPGSPADAVDPVAVRCPLRVWRPTQIARRPAVISDGRDDLNWFSSMAFKTSPAARGVIDVDPSAMRMVE